MQPLIADHLHIWLGSPRRLVSRFGGLASTFWQSL